MKPIDLYNKTPIRTTKDLYELMNPWYNHIAEINVDEIDYKKNDKIELKIYFDPYIDGERCCTVGAAYYLYCPVMIFRHAGRGGHDEHDEYITDIGCYKEMVDYLRSLATKPEDDNLLVISEQDDAPYLNTFYGHSFQ